jgi:hypothetical protein
MSYEFTWKKGSVVKLDAQSTGEYLYSLAEKGDLTADIVLEDAKNKDSPLHSFFDWNNKVAAEKWRHTQAAYLLRSVEVKLGEDTEPIRAFAHIRLDEPVYSTIITAMSNKQKREYVVKKAWEELKDWRSRYNEYKELAAVFAAMDKAA